MKMIDTGIISDNLMRILPGVLAADPNAAALAQMLAAAFAEEHQLIDLARIYSRIDELPESLLDILAYDFKADWYDYDATVAVKRRLIKTCVAVHRTIGTKSAVETALGAVYPGSHIKEWFEYGGAPYHFKLTVDVTDSGFTLAQYQAMIYRLQYYKNLRSHLGGVEMTETVGAFDYSAAVMTENVRECFFGFSPVSPHTVKDYRGAAATEYIRERFFAAPAETPHIRHTYSAGIASEYLKEVFTV
jgi:phage tail P2-like protein